jgi:hypothetical protein
VEYPNDILVHIEQMFNAARKKLFFAEDLDTFRKEGAEASMYASMLADYGAKRGRFVFRMLAADYRGAPFVQELPDRHRAALACIAAYESKIEEFLRS